MAVQDGVLEHVQIGRGVFRGRIVHTSTAASRVDWGSYALSVLARGDLSREMVSLTLGLGGCGDWRVHGQAAANGDMIVFPEGGELLVALPPQAQWLSVQVPRGRIEGAGLVLSRCLEGSARRMAGVIDTGLMQTLVDLAPVLTGYAGQDWLKKFIADPQAHYAGESGNNAMPGFKDQLSPKDLDMLVKYLTGDYYRKGTDARH